MIRKLFEAGADVFRINMSHTPHDKMRELVQTIRNVESSYGRPIGILVDLQGPKLRLEAFAEGSTQLKNGQSFVPIPTRRRATTAACSFRIRKFSQPCGPAMRCCSTTARFA